MKEKVKFVEVGPRDGLQNENVQLSSDAKAELISRLVDAGVSSLEAGSFVSPKAIPQMADSEEVFKKVPKTAKADFIFLVANEKGLERAMQAGVSSIALFTATSDSFTQKNIRCSVEESLQRFESLSKEAKSKSLSVRGYVSTVFGCPYEGPQDVSRAIEVSRRLFNMGCDEVSLGDTIGVAHPKQVREFWKDFRSEIKESRVAGHFHDTRGSALANVLVSLEEGIRIFDGSVGGLGGCPYAPGASGNVASEEVLWLLEGQGLETGVSIEKLLDCISWFESHLNRPIKSKLYLSDPKRLYYHRS